MRRIHFWVTARAEEIVGVAHRFRLEWQRELKEAAIASPVCELCGGLTDDMDEPSSAEEVLIMRLGSSGKFVFLVSEIVWKQADKV